MIKDQNQEAGDNSTNLQGKTIIINQGISYTDAKQIALDVFRANFLELSALAKETAKARAEELIDNFLTELQQRAPENINKMEDPGMQFAIYTAQKEYARTGDKDLSKLLVDILVDRSKQEERDLKQIVLDESLSVATKLTARQLDTLTIIFISKYTISQKVLSIPLLKEYLMQYFLPFINSLSKEHSLYQHLEFAGCGSISLGETNLQEVFRSNYSGVFQKGVSQVEVEKRMEAPMNSFGDMFIPCLRDETLFQVNAVNVDQIGVRAKQRNIEGVPLEKLKLLMSDSSFSALEVKQELCVHCPEFNALFDTWDNSSLKSMTLTSVGIALAQANLRVKTGIAVDLGIWIK